MVRYKHLIIKTLTNKVIYFSLPFIFYHLVEGSQKRHNFATRKFQKLKTHFIMIHKLFSAAMLLTASTCVMAQEAATDSTVNNKEVKNRNVMLNASADNQPRQISIGLPAEMSATIFEDGTPVSRTWWPLLPYFYWAASPAYSHVGMTSLGENTITNGEVNYTIDSWTAKGGKEFRGNADYTTNSFGLQRFDVAVSGPIAKGWSYSAAAYANLDPGTNKLASGTLQNNMKQFFGGLTKTFANNKGDISLFYKYSNSHMYTDATGPFYYEGDGSVKEFEGFDLGKDGFLPANNQVTFLDVTTGQYKTIQLDRATSAISNDLKLVLNYNFRPDLHLLFLSKYHYANVHYNSMSEAGVGQATAADGLTYAYDTGTHKAGEVYTGNYNSRWFTNQPASEYAWYNTVELKGVSKNRRHNWRAGYNLWWILPEERSSTGIYAHTVEKDPYWLYRGGSQGTLFNTGADYYDTHELKTALYASDDWQATDRLFLSAGARLEYYALGGHNAYSTLADEKEPSITQNVRSMGWNLNQAQRTKLSESWVLPSFTINTRYTIAHGFGVEVEGIYSMSAPGSPNFASYKMPNVDPINTYFGRAGLFWNTPWMKLVSQATFINKTNYQRGSQFTNPNNASDVVSMNTTYDVMTLGWTTDAVFTPFKGFNFHTLLTLQSPKYKNYDFTVNFNDGTSSDYNFNDMYTTGVSKVIVELDPSYMFSKFRLWASFRYQSKQYINRTNSLYFNGRWETFAGVDYNLNKHISLSANFVNLFNQKGASGSISSADLVTDTTPYNHYLMAGSYIRPFTMEFAAHINF